jgi:hypothetical protein
MHSPIALLSLPLLFLLLRTTTIASQLPQPQYIFSNPSNPSENDFKIPTPYESAIMARRMLRLETLGTLSTTFPNTTEPQTRPTDVAGLPFGLPEYFADCEPATGNPTILAITIASTFRNVAAGSNVTLSLRWHPPTNKYPWPHTPVALPRFALTGYLEMLSREEIRRGGFGGEGLALCFARYHPDSVIWMPGNRIHESHWVRFVVTELFWVGGFGDRAYIGWIPLDMWQAVTEEEIQSARLPGEVRKKTLWGRIWEL